MIQPDTDTAWHGLFAVGCVASLDFMDTNKYFIWNKVGLFPLRLTAKISMSSCMSRDV